MSHPPTSSPFAYSCGYVGQSLYSFRPSLISGLDKISNVEYATPVSFTAATTFALNPHLGASRSPFMNSTTGDCVVRRFKRVSSVSPAGESSKTETAAAFGASSVSFCFSLSRVTSASLGWRSAYDAIISLIRFALDASSRVGAPSSSSPSSSRDRDATEAPCARRRRGASARPPRRTLALSDSAANDFAAAAASVARRVGAARAATIAGLAAAVARMTSVGVARLVYARSPLAEV
eukprot:31490-Pelagococcus_subviridis.AAC.5